MLAELVVRDLALLEHVALSFGAGFNVITGETGAGKSLLVGALELLMGERPRPGLVRTGAKSAVVEARFLVPMPAGERVERWLRTNLPQIAEAWDERADDEADADERELILGRTVSSDGKTRAYVNQRPVTRAMLQELAQRLFEIHGQNDHQKLFDPSEQLRLLDGFGALEAEVKLYRESRARWKSLVDDALQLERDERERRDRLELARFQLAEISAAAPELGERERLGPEREILRSAEGLKAGLGNLVDELSESESSLVDRVRRAESFLASWREKVGALGAAADEIAAARVHLEEAASALRSLLERLEVDPARLEAVEERLAELERLERKYGLGSAELVARARELEGEIAALESDERSLGELDLELPRARGELLECGRDLRRARKALREKLVRAVHKVLKELGLPRAEFDLRLGQRTEVDEDAPHSAPRDRAALESDLKLFGERGIDRIEFLLSANPGEPLQRLRQVASGGETARIMLALRSVLARGERGRVLVFDEIDAGVGGRLGPTVGAHLAKLSQHHQVLCVTHLPAIAAAAARHLRVTKSVHEGRTRTEVRELSGEARVEEVADMIAGGADQETARAEARRLIGSG